LAGCLTATPITIQLIHQLTEKKILQQYSTNHIILYKMLLCRDSDLTASVSSSASVAVSIN